MIRRNKVAVEEIKVVNEEWQTIVSCDGPGCTVTHIKDRQSWGIVKDIPETWFTVHGGDCWSSRHGERQLCSAACLHIYAVTLASEPA